MNENELDINFDQVEEDVEKKLQVKDRFAKLSENITLERRAKEEAAAKAKAEEDARLKAERERDFYKNFSELSVKHPGAVEYQDQILDKVLNKGYDPEDAVISTLGKEGKLGTQSARIEQPMVAGGSAMTNLSEGSKSASELGMSEKLAALQELEQSGELQKALRGGINTGM